MAHRTTGEIRFSLIGLIAFSVALLVAGGVLVLGGLATGAAHSKVRAASEPDASPATNLSSPGRREVPPWGDLVVRDIAMERPEEYIGFELGTNRESAWVFEGMTLDGARALMLSCGLTAAQASHALSRELSSTNSAGTVVHPDAELILGLSAATRGKFYHELARFGANRYMQFPFNVPGDEDAWFAGSKVDKATVALVKRLLYPRGEALSFSDFEFVLRGLASDDERMALMKALSRQKGLLARVRIGPDTDIERLLGYWGRGIQVKDARPLLESVRRLPEGGSISLLYLLPRFARERLYTFPLPPKPDDPAVDCHWTTMNFFREEPDGRFANPGYTVQYLKTNCYVVARPSQYGDIVLVLNDEGNAVHSAVYLADDIVFTKNGNNFAQPWMLMRLKDLLVDYAWEGPAKTAIYRDRAL